MATEHPDNGQYIDYGAYGLQIDLRQYGGGGLFTRGTGGGAFVVSLPTWSQGAGVFDDPVQFACGYGVLTTLTSLYAAAWAALGGLAGTIDLYMVGDGANAGHLRFEADDAFKVSAESVVGQNTAWGFDAGEVIAVLDGGRYVVTAPTRPRWGNIDTTPKIETASGFIDLGASRYHSPFVALVSAAGGNHLEDVDNAAIDAAAGGGTPDRGVRWFVTIDGRIGWAAPTGTVDEITAWSSRAIRQMLGWTGRETVTTSLGLDIQIGDRPCLRFWRPERPVRAQPFTLDLPTEAQRLDDGSIASNENGTFELDEWGLYLDGPADLVSTYGSGDYAQAIPDYDRIVHGFLPYARRGAKISCWQSWPEHRAYQNLIEVDVDTDAFTGLITSAGRYIGRIDGRIAVSVGDITKLAYDTALRRSLPVTLYTQRR